MDGLLTGSSFKVFNCFATYTEPLRCKQVIQLDLLLNLNFPNTHMSQLRSLSLLNHTLDRFSSIE